MTYKERQVITKATKKKDNKRIVVFKPKTWDEFLHVMEEDHRRSLKRYKKSLKDNSKGTD